MSTSLNRRRTTLILATIAVASIATVALADHGFTDVPHGHTHEDGIEYVADVGVTQGCTDDEYCPSDPVTRAQMATFLFRASGHDPQTAASVNAATLAGSGPAAYTTTVSSTEADANVSLAGASVGDPAVALQLADLSAGEYVISGQAQASGLNTDASRIVCRLRVDGDLITESINRVGGDPGNSVQANLPISGHVSIPSGTADVDLACFPVDVSGAVPHLAGDNGRTHMIATRVGDAS